MKAKFLLAAGLLLALFLPPARAADGDVDTSFDQGASDAVLSLALQPDGQILVGGRFMTMNGPTRYRIARLSASGSLDSAFNPGASNHVYCMAVQTDGKILVGGIFTNIAGTGRNYIARLNGDGTVDASFNPNANERVNCIRIQPDGKILLGGYFTTLRGTTRNRVARLNADGSLDTGFNPNANSYVFALGLQTDGKILMGGSFTNLAGVARNYMARVNADGTLDTTFNPSANATVYAIAVQPDGKILAGGAFRQFGVITREHIALLTAEGIVDPNFNPDASDYVYTIVQQVDGKILLGGYFTTIGGVTCNHVGRLNANGSLDTVFNPNASSYVYGLALQPDGKVLVGGFFTAIGGGSHGCIARLLNGTVGQALTIPDQTSVRWLRSGTAAQVEMVTFDMSIDAGAHWTSLGPGTRISSGWQLTGLSLPGVGLMRAQGRTVGGEFNGSSGLLVSTQAFSFGSNNISLIPTGSVWKYLDTGTNLGTAWKETNFNDSAWASGPAQLGYGDGDEATVVSYGPDANNKYITTYFRRSFYLPNTSWITNLAARYIRDDGAVVYLNGVEVFRSHMPDGPVSYTTLASAAEDASIENAFHTNAIPAGLLVSGTNVIAVEVHQAAVASSDISFDLELIANSALVRTIDPLPPPWIDLDVGGPALAGGASYVTNRPVWMVQGGGVDIWGTNDQFHFVYQTITGDCDIRTRVAAVATINTWSKAGVMMRQSLAANAANAFVPASPASGVLFQWRTTSGGTTSQSVQSGPGAPYWVRLVRAGNTFTGYASSDGVNWTQISVTSITMSTTIYVGLAVTSKDNTKGCMAAFDQVSGLSSASNHQDIGSPGVAGSVFIETNSPVFLVNGSGADIWGTGDEYNYVFQPVNGNCALQARVAAVGYSTSYAKVGVMIRETLNESSKHMIMAITPAHGAFAQWRTTTDGSTSYSGDSNETTPSWVRLVRNGEMLTAYKSSNGVNWTQVYTVATSLGDTIYAGLAVTAQDNSASTVAAFDSVSFVPVINSLIAVDGDLFYWGDPIELHADAADHDGHVTLVKYYDQNTNFLGAASAPPYAFIWTNAPPGMNYVSARAVDDQGVDGAPLTHAVFVEVPDTHVWFYSQFASNAGLILQSDAVVTNGLLRVSQAHNSTDGGAWLAQRAYVAKGFDSIFQFQINNTYGDGADGFAVVIQGSSTPLLGNGAAGLGYDNLTNSLAVEFDTYQNPELNDVNANHIGVHTRGTQANSANESAAIAVMSSLPNLSDGSIHTVRIAYNGTALRIYLDNLITPVLTTGLVLTNTLSLPDGKAWVGFTAGSGGYYENHDILNWAFVTTNLHPFISLTTPTNGAVFLPTDSLVLNAAATDLDGTIQQVVFFVDGNYAGSATNSPWQLPVGALPAGPHILSAAALDDTDAATVSAPVTILVNTQPLARCRDVTVPADATCTALANIDAGSYDVDFQDEILLTQTPPAPYPLGSTVVTLTAIDTHGASNVCTATVTVVDTTPPTITCTSDITVSTATGSCFSNVAFTVTGSDLCGAVNVLCVPPSGSAFAKGPTPVNCTATDAASNTATCTFTVTVNDLEPPQITCPSDIAVSTASGSCASNVVFTALATDNCGTVNVACVPSSGSAFAVGANLVNCVATDPAGHSNACSFTITVNDPEPPQITCPADIMVGTAGGSCASNLAFAVTATDNCWNVNALCVPPSGSAFAKGLTPVNCTATDAASNTATCTFTVTVTDPEPPQITCPTDIAVSTASGSCFSNVVFTATATDNCGTVNVLCVPPSGSAFAVGTNLVNCTATDSASNTATCAFTVTINDPEPPQITCPTNLVVAADAGQCAKSNVTLVASATDNCAVTNMVCEPASGSTFAVGTNLVNCTATDASGNTASCNFTVTILDTEPPAIIWPANLVVNPPAGSNTATVTFTVTAADNCDPSPVIVCAPPSGSTFPVGTTSIQCMATDTAGNTNACTFTIRVNARPLVSLVVPTNNATFPLAQPISLLADASDPDGDGVARVDFFAGTNLLGSATSGYLFVWTNAPVGPHSLAARATDGAGAEATSSAVQITVFTQPPTTYAPVTSSNLNRQTGLYVQPVRITNPTASAFDALRLWIALDTNSLAHNVRVWNATGTSNGIPFVLYNQPLPPGQSVELSIEYYIPDRRTMPNPVFTVERISASTPPDPAGMVLEVDRALRLADGTFWVEFSTLSNRIYYLQYSGDVATWKTALPAILGTGHRVSWRDAGPPKTENAPQSVSNRFYRIILLP